MAAEVTVLRAQAALERLEEAAEVTVLRAKAALERLEEAVAAEVMRRQMTLFFSSLASVQYFPNQEQVREGAAAAEETRDHGSSGLQNP